jgi:hypothetical protein
LPQNEFLWGPIWCSGAYRGWTPTLGTRMSVTFVA